MNGFHNARMPSSKYIALLHDGASRRNDSRLHEKCDGKPIIGSYEANNSSKTPYIPIRSSRVPWLNAFLHKSSRYVDFLAAEEACGRGIPSSPSATPAPTPTLDAAAPSYAQMRRISSRPLLCRGTGITPFSLEWALDELLTADKWLHEKYGPNRKQKDSSGGQSGDGSDDEASVSNFPTRVLGRGDSHGTLDPGVSRTRHPRCLDMVAENSVYDLNNEERDRHRSNTMPRNLKELFAVGKKKTPSTCSLPDPSRMEVITRFLAAEG